MRYKKLSLALGAALVFSALLAAAAVPAAASIVGAGSVNSMLRGIPQQGIELGKPSAPVTLVEFVEPQCPGCGQWARSELPGVISRYVRTGKVRIEYRGLAFISADSTGLLTLAQAAGEQSKLWNVVELEYANQGPENSGYATHAYLMAIAKAVPGLDVNEAFARAGSSKVASLIEQASSFAQQYGINSTPSLAIGKTGDEQNLTVMASTTGQGLTNAIDAALAGNPVQAKSGGLPAWAIVLLIMAGVVVLSGAINLAVRLSRRPPAA
ncbi:MAG: thioredoxin domain-containing protein [Gaiellaceae bacterium]